MDVCRPPDNLTAAGALGELCGLRVGYHDDESGLRGPFQLGLAALPRAGAKPVDTVSCLPPEARGLKPGVTLTRNLADFLPAELGFVRPFSDAALV